MKRPEIVARIRQMLADLKKEGRPMSERELSRAAYEIMTEKPAPKGGYDIIRDLERFPESKNPHDKLVALAKAAGKPENYLINENVIDEDALDEEAEDSRMLESAIAIARRTVATLPDHPAPDSLQSELTLKIYRSMKRRAKEGEDATSPASLGLIETLIRELIVLTLKS